MLGPHAPGTLGRGGGGVSQQVGVEKLEEA